MNKVRALVLTALKILGAFALARHIYRKRLRILCYHGMSVGDQHEFAPILFMRAETFARRMRLLVSQGWRLVDLETAVRELRDGKVRDKTVVVTIDDGWLSTLTEAVPILEEYSVPATVYITTYYSERSADVFNVAVYYMLWKTRVEKVDIRAGYGGFDGEYDLSKDRVAVGNQWVEFAETHLSWEQRQELLPVISNALHLEPESTFQSGRFRIVDREQVRQLHERGIDVQLHTHRHRLPDVSFEALRDEVTQNKVLLDTWTGKSCMHFCYPSGVYNHRQSEWLERIGILSSTTCDPGMNDTGAHPQRLRRILDRESWSDLEFDAAMSGVRRLFSRRQQKK